MSHQSSDHEMKGRFSGLPLDEVERLDNLCDCFEQQLLANQKPTIESFMAGCPPTSREPLLRELLMLELEYLLHANIAPLP